MPDLSDIYETAEITTKDDDPVRPEAHICHEDGGDCDCFEGIKFKNAYPPDCRTAQQHSHHHKK